MAEARDIIRKVSRAEEEVSKVGTVSTIFHPGGLILHSLGLRRIISSGLAGGPGGRRFQDFVDDSFEVAEVNIWGGFFIDAVQFIYRSRYNPGQVSGPKHGGPGGTLSEPLGLNLWLQPGEYITEISGRFGNFVDPLQIRTNVRLYNRCGGQGGGQDYQFLTPENFEVIGWLGASGDYVDAIGVLWRERG